jgi:hypothetical protein
MALKPAVSHTSSADDYRSVIDDLTVEIQRLKEELRRYRQHGSDPLKKEKLFEIKVHGLPQRKKRELEATLRDFAASLDGSQSMDATSSQRNKSRHRNRMYSGSASLSKHASSSSGSRSRPVDSAYASMSTGAKSSGPSVERPLMSSRARSSEQKVENYLKDIPEGLYPRHMAMTDKQKKKLVVRRLEQLFTGKTSERHLRQNESLPPTSGSMAPVVVESPASGGIMTAHQPPSLQPEATREARILPLDSTNSKTRSRDNGSTSNSNGDRTESGGNGQGAAGPAMNTSPPIAPPLEQRPTRPRDLDPDRVQIPSENMEYIRHLGLVPPELLPASKHAQAVSPDDDGWVYLNLLCNLAQLHIVNVTPDFIRAAVSEKSAKFQLSPDGRKIRWRGGTTGTRFSSDSSGDNSQNSPLTDDAATSNKDESRRRQKTRHSGEESKAEPQVSSTGDSFHYKPLFIRRISSDAPSSVDDTGSSYGLGQDSNIDDSMSGSSPRKKRRLDGAIIYYSGAPFCTDLSGDPGDYSLGSYDASNRQEEQQVSELNRSVEVVRPDRPMPNRTSSGSSLPFRPFSHEWPVLSESMDVDQDTTLPGLVTDSADEGEDGVDADFPWSDSQGSGSQEELAEVPPLEPCGLGGVVPDDRFIVVVNTRRPKCDAPARAPAIHHDTHEAETDYIISRLASMSASSPVPRQLSVPLRGNLPAVEIEYLSGRVKRLPPLPLPPPVSFIPPFSSDSSEGQSDFGSEDDDPMETSEEELMSRRANPHQSDITYPEDEDITTADEEGEEPDDDEDAPGMDGESGVAEVDDNQSNDSGEKEERRARTGTRDSMAAPQPATRRGSSNSADMMVRTGSSVATAGDAESGYSSSQG